MDLMTVILITASVTAVMAVLIRRGQIEEKRKIENRLNSSWGIQVPQLFSAEQMKSIRAFSDAASEYGILSETNGENFAVDDITAEDIDLDVLFGRIAGQASSPGREVLYAWLRHPLPSRRELEKRIEAENYFCEHEKERRDILRALYQTGSLKKGSFFEAVTGLAGVEPVGKNSYLFLSVCTVFLLVLLFIAPLIAICALIPVLFLDFRLHLKMKERILPGMLGFQAILRLLHTADEIIARDIRLPWDLNPELKKLVQEFSGFKKGSVFLVSGSGAGTGISEAVLEYVRMFFHIDLICFDSMLNKVRHNADRAVRLLYLIGETEAVLTAASYRSSLETFCIPEEEPGEELFFEDLVHPLLKRAVPNSLRTARQVLVTGSNASGKSTFLKSAALSAVLGQSLGFVPARTYRAPMYRVMTSMALKDNLFEGESYFIVELRSLRRICEEAEKPGPPVLAVIDEILRGTNTVERISASSSVLEVLAHENIRIFAATHDTELTVLLDGCFRNMHFEETVSDGRVFFDYRIKEGAASGRNAIRLLGETGYPHEMTGKAEKRAEHFEKTGEWI